MPLDIDIEDITKIGVAVGVGIAIVAYPYLDEIKLFFTNKYLLLVNIWHLFTTYLFPIILGLILTMVLAVILFKSLKLFTRKILNKIEEIRAFKQEEIDVESLLEAEQEYNEQKLIDEIENIKHFTNSFKVNRRLKRFNLSLKKRLAKARELLSEIKRDKRVAERESKLIQIKKEIEQKDEENRIKATYEESDDELILYQLRADEKNIFKTEKLSKKQIKTLEKNGFEQKTEYSVFEKKYIRVLVKPKLNHSRTHAFLVWDAKRLLESFEGIRNIQEHLVVEADITFNFNNKKYALEIETGTLLGKKQQTQEKVADLNKKYPKRWMFIVSNKNLLPKYQKLGFTTQRKWVLENLKKLLEIA